MGPLKMLKWLCSSEENYIGQSAVRFDLWGEHRSFLERGSEEVA